MTLPAAHTKSRCKPFSTPPQVNHGLGSLYPRNSEESDMNRHEKSTLKFNGSKNYSLDDIPILVVFLILSIAHAPDATI